jgi:hypothetical protein
MYVQTKLHREALDYLDSIKNRQKIGRAGKVDYDKLKFSNEIVRLLNANTTLSFSDPYFDFPSDYMLCQEVFFGSVAIDEIQASEKRVLNSLEPSELYPVYLEHSTGVEVIPDTIETDVTMYYYKNVEDPKWTYTEVSGNPLFNEDASDFVDFSLPESIFDEIVVELALYFGIQLKQPDITQVFTRVDGQNEQLKREQ